MIPAAGSWKRPGEKSRLGKFKSSGAGLQTKGKEKTRRRLVGSQEPHLTWHSKEFGLSPFMSGHDMQHLLSVSYVQGCWP